MTAVLAGAVLIATNLLMAPGQSWAFEHPPTPGDRIKAITVDGLVVEGRFDGFQGSGMLVTSAGHPMVLGPERVQALWSREKIPRPIVRFAVRGLLLGAMLSSVVVASQWADGCYDGAYCPPDETATAADLVAMTTFFGLVGGTWGAFVTHGPERLIYATPPQRPLGPTLQYTLSF